MGAKGRIVIPKEVLEQADIKEGDEVTFEITKVGNILLKVSRNKKETND